MIQFFRRLSTKGATRPDSKQRIARERQSIARGAYRGQCPAQRVVRLGDASWLSGITAEHGARDFVELGTKSFQDIRPAIHHRLQQQNKYACCALRRFVSPHALGNDVKSGQGRKSDGNQDALRQDEADR